MDINKSKITHVKVDGSWWPVAKRNPKGWWVHGGINIELLTNELIEDKLASGIYQEIRQALAE